MIFDFFVTITLFEKAKTNKTKAKKLLGKNCFPLEAMEHHTVVVYAKKISIFRVAFTATVL